MARVFVITNPVAARTNSDDRLAVERVFRASGWQVEGALTKAPGDARRLAAEALDLGADVVVAFGGDGTTMQAAAALVGTGVALGIVPGGTGNVLAGNLRLPSAPVPAAQVIARGRSRLIDLGRLERADGTHYFAVAAGVGADAKIMAQTKTAEKRQWGIGGYFATLFRTLSTIRNSPYRITIDGETVTMMAADALVLNCSELIPPLIRAVRGAELDDGILDVVVLAADTPYQCGRGLFRAIVNGWIGTGSTPYLLYARGREITVQTEVVQPVQYDGEVAGTTPVTAVVVPRSLRIMADGAQ
ncbi:MAG: diacylglycerol kinase family protein [Gemmatimonadota bacterium]